MRIFSMPSKQLLRYDDRCTKVDLRCRFDWQVEIQGVPSLSLGNGRSQTFFKFVLVRTDLVLRSVVGDGGKGGIK